MAHYHRPPPSYINGNLGKVCLKINVDLSPNIIPYQIANSRSYIQHKARDIREDLCFVLNKVCSGMS